MSSTLGAPLGGTTRGAHHGLDCAAFSLITPPNFGSGAGSCFPSMVVVALGEPGTPVTCCALTGRTADRKKRLARANSLRLYFISSWRVVSFSRCLRQKLFIW